MFYNSAFDIMGNVDRVADLVRQKDMHLSEIERIDSELRKLVVPEGEGPGKPTATNNGHRSMAEAAISAIEKAGRSVTFRELAATLESSNPQSLRSTLYRLVQEGRIRKGRGRARYIAVTNKDS